MRLCRLTCLVHAGVSIEDISVHLPGKGSSVIVNSDAAIHSKDLASRIRMVRVEHLPQQAPMPIWPFVKAPIPKEPVALPSSSREDFDVLLRRMETVSKDVKSLFDVISSIPGRANPSTESLPGLPMQSDPMFIPEHIVPPSIEVRMKVSEEEISKDDFESSHEALKKMRQGR